MKHRILIVDDESSICISLVLSLQPEFTVEWDTDPVHALERLKKESFDLVLLDMVIGKYDGIDILEKIKALQPHTAVIMMTAYGTISTSVSAIKKGAFTYLTKPLDMEELLVYIHQALEIRMLNHHIAYLSEQLNDQTKDQILIGHSPAIRKIREMIELFSHLDSNILISGESGSGKDLVAHEIYKRCQSGLFVPIHCSSVKEQWLKEELFGCHSGHLPNSVQMKIGKLQHADQGTLYLDEVADLPYSVQTLLLHALQEGIFSPLGSSESRPFNTRIISSTSKNLLSLVASGKFRSDLYYRLNTLEILLPPLREHKEDIPNLCEYFIRSNKTLLSKTTPLLGISPEALNILAKHDFPGNVRELLNIIEYAGILEKGSFIEAEDLPCQFNDNANVSVDDRFLKGKKIQDLEKIAILSSYKRHQGKRKDMAAELGISERSLWNKLKIYGLNKRSAQC